MKKIIMIRAGFWVKLFLIVLTAFVIFSAIHVRLTPKAVTVSTEPLKIETPSPPSRLAEQIKNIDVSFWQKMMINGYSLLENNQPNHFERFFGFQLNSPYEQLGQGMGILKWLDRQNFGSQNVMTAIENEDFYLDTETMVDDWHFELSNLSDVSLSQDVAVLLYHTHNAETYSPTDGTSKRPGENGGVSTAAEVLKDSLEQKYGLKTLHSKVLHDYPNWNRSYINSLGTVKDLLAAHPKVQAVFDIHRDAGFTSKEPTTLTLNGQKAAKIMIVVGANHENWQSNLSFAQKLEDRSNEIYPGLVRSIRIVQANRYNQQAHPHSLILEVGSDLNTQEEANFALECFAQVIADVLLARE